MCIGFKWGFRKRQAHIIYNHPGSSLVSGEAAWLVQGLTTIVNLCNSIDNVTEFVVLSMEVYTFKRSDYININLWLRSHLYILKLEFLIQTWQTMSIRNGIFQTPAQQIVRKCAFLKFRLMNSVQFSVEGVVSVSLRCGWCRLLCAAQPCSSSQLVSDYTWLDWT